MSLSSDGPVVVDRTGDPESVWAALAERQMHMEDMVVAADARTRKAIEVLEGRDAPTPSPRALVEAWLSGVNFGEIEQRLLAGGDFASGPKETLGIILREMAAVDPRLD